MYTVTAIKDGYITSSFNIVVKEDEDVDNVLQCLKKWDFSHRIEESVISEYIGIVYLLVHRHELEIKLAVFTLTDS